MHSSKDYAKQSYQSTMIANQISNSKTNPQTEKTISQELSFASLWAWLKTWTIAKIKKYTITVILLPNIIQSLIKSATENYEGHQTEFILIGIIVSLMNFMLVSFFLYRWFVTGKGGVREITKQKLAEISNIKEQILSYFVPGNQGNLLKLYCLVVFTGLLSQILPDAVFKGGIGLVADLYKQIRNYIINRYRTRIQQLQQYFYQLLLQIQSSLPKYPDYVKSHQN